MSFYRNMYFLSVLAIFKNEAINLKVWLDHYLWQGVEHFYLIDNGSTDESRDVLKPYVECGLVTYFYTEERHKQVELYRRVFDAERIKEKTYWLAICDLDEFFYGVHKKLATALKTKELDYYHTLYCHWHMFGSDRLIAQPTDIRTGIIHRKPVLDSNTKYIFKPATIKHSSMIWIHGLVTPGTNVVIQEKYHPRIKVLGDGSTIRLNHYPIQSLEFFQKVKMTRGSANVAAHDKIRDMAYFRRYDEGTIFKDDTLKQLVENTPETYI